MSTSTQKLQVTQLLDAISEGDSKASNDLLPLISYFDRTNGDLKVAHCNDLDCSSATITTLDSAGTVGYATAITIGPDGLGLISYLDDTNDKLKIAHCTDVACTSATTSSIASVAWQNEDRTSITIGVDGLAVVSCRDTTNKLRATHLSNPLGIPYYRRR